MTTDASWTIDDIEATSLVGGQTPTFPRGETIELKFSFRGSGQVANYETLREYLEFASERSIRVGTGDRGVPWVRERLPDRANNDSLVVPLEPGPGVEEIDGHWVAIVGGDDESRPTSDSRYLELEVFVLADIDEYANREDLFDDLGSEVI